MEFKGKKVLVLGAGISGMSVARVLQNIGAQVTLNDAKSEEQLKKDFKSLTDMGIGLALGHQREELLADVDYLVVSPGVSIFIPLIQAARAKGVIVMSEIEVAYHLCPSPILAVTGTNGKTTTTTLLGEMLSTTGREVVVGGNIGLALSQEVCGISRQGTVVAEISSFQLEGIIDFRPHVAAILNVTPDHLDRHHSMENYIAMKERIFANQSDSDFLVLNYDDAVVRDMGRKTSAKVVFFSQRQTLDEGIYVKGDEIVIKTRNNIVSVCSLKDILLPGAHNIENILAACGVAFLAGVTPEGMAKVLATFTGVEHRIEPVKTINDVTYYNDSKATNPESAIKALEAFTEPIILIAGGRDKKTDLTLFMELIRRKTQHLILLGEAKERFGMAAAQEGVQNIHYVQSMEEAVSLAHALAKAPQVVLLSPACSSYDMFNNYEERGKIFKDLVRKL